MIEKHNSIFSFSFRRLEDCLYSRRYGHKGIILFGKYSLLFKIRI
jgi:hypothetical protein